MQEKLENIIRKKEGKAENISTLWFKDSHLILFDRLLFRLLRNTGYLKMKRHE
jgi:hypothetical protein